MPMLPHMFQLRESNSDAAIALALGYSTGGVKIWQRPRPIIWARDMVKQVADINNQHQYWDSVAWEKTFTHPVNIDVLRDHLMTESLITAVAMDEQLTNS